ncbi:hypothetical protein CSUI_004642, partial [Cystoisospora suis]
MKRFYFFNGLDQRTRDALITVEDAPLHEIYKMLERLGGRSSHVVLPAAPPATEAVSSHDFTEPMDISESFAVTTQRNRGERNRRPFQAGVSRQDFDRRERGQRLQPAQQSRSRELTCYYCHKQGHTYTACQALRRAVLQGR